MRRRLLVTAGVLTLAGWAVSFGSMGASAASPDIAVSAFTQSGTTLDASSTSTLESKPITVSVHLVDPVAASMTAGSRNAYLVQSFVAAPGSYIETNGSPSPVIVTLLTLSSGTPGNGTWTGTLNPSDPGWAGTMAVTGVVIDGNDANGQYIKTTASTAALTAAGAKPVTAKVPAAPGKPSNISSASLPGWNMVQGLHILGTVSWTTSGPAPTAVTVESFSGCGPTRPLTNGLASFAINNPPFGFCTIKFHVWNSAGASPAVSYTAFFL